MPKVVSEDLVRLTRNVKKIQLQEICLSESSCKLGTIRAGKLPTRAMQSIGIQLQADKETQQATVRILFKLVVTYDEPEDADPPISVTAAFVLHDAIAKAFPKKILKQTVRSTATMMAWSYWRDFVHSMTMRMGLPAFPIPLFSVTDLEEYPRTTEE
jgi:hypothetical protein